MMRFRIRNTSAQKHWPSQSLQLPSRSPFQLLTGEFLVSQRAARPVADLAHTVALAERLVRHVAERVGQLARTPSVLVALQRRHLEGRIFGAVVGAAVVVAAAAAADVDDTRFRDVGGGGRWRLVGARIDHFHGEDGLTVGTFGGVAAAWGAGFGFAGISEIENTDSNDSDVTKWLRGHVEKK